MSDWDTLVGLRKLQANARGIYARDFTYTYCLLPSPRRIWRMLSFNERDIWTNQDLADLAQFCEDFILYDHIGVSSGLSDLIGRDFLYAYSDPNDYPLFDFTKQVSKGFESLRERDQRDRGQIVDMDRGQIVEMDRGQIVDMESEESLRHLFALLPSMSDEDRNALQQCLLSQDGDAEQIASTILERSLEKQRLIHNAKQLAPTISYDDVKQSALKLLELSFEAKRLTLELKRQTFELKRQAFELQRRTHENIASVDLYHDNRSTTDPTRISYQGEQLARLSLELGLNISPGSAYSPILLAQDRNLSFVQRINSDVKSLHHTVLEKLEKWTIPKSIDVPPFLSVLLSQCHSREDLIPKLVTLRAQFTDLREALRAAQKDFDHAESLAHRIKSIERMDMLRNQLLKKASTSPTSSVIRRTWLIAKKGSLLGIATELADQLFDIGGERRMLGGLRRFIDIERMALTAALPSSSIRKLFGEVSSNGPTP